MSNGNLKKEKWGKLAQVLLIKWSAVQGKEYCVIATCTCTLPAICNRCCISRNSSHWLDNCRNLQQYHRDYCQYRVKKVGAVYYFGCTTMCKLWPLCSLANTKIKSQLKGCKSVRALIHEGSLRHFTHKCFDHTTTWQRSWTRCCGLGENLNASYRKSTQSWSVLVRRQTRAVIVYDLVSSFSLKCSSPTRSASSDATSTTVAPAAATAVPTTESITVPSMTMEAHAIMPADSTATSAATKSMILTATAY